jgi:hypothetical protein
MVVNARPLTEVQNALLRFHFYTTALPSNLLASNGG